MKQQGTSVLDAPQQTEKTPPRERRRPRPETLAINADTNFKDYQQWRYTHRRQFASFEHQMTLAEFTGCLSGTQPEPRQRLLRWREGMEHHAQSLEERIRQLETENRQLRQDKGHLSKKAAQEAWRARHDPLTDLLNPRGLQEEAVRHIKQALKFKFPVVLIMLDLNKFKRINDTYGHVFGDKLIKQVAKFLLATYRTDNGEDIIARYGGDEFVVVVNLEEQYGDTMQTFEEVLVRRILTNFQSTIEHYTLVEADIRIPLRLSLGCATLSFHKRHQRFSQHALIDGTLVRQNLAPLSRIKSPRNLFLKLLDIADQGMYIAKG